MHVPVAIHHPPPISSDSPLSAATPCNCALLFSFYYYKNLRATQLQRQGGKAWQHHLSSVWLSILIILSHPFHARAPNRRRLTHTPFVCALGDALLFPAKAKWSLWIRLLWRPHRMPIWLRGCRLRCNTNKEDNCAVRRGSGREKERGRPLNGWGRGGN